MTRSLPMKGSERLTVNMFRDAPWPGNIFSNFAETPFVVDGIFCTCSKAFIQSLKLEAFIQSLKLSDPTEQAAFCSLKGQEAWEKGSMLTESVFASGKVWWRGSSLPLHSDEHFKWVKKGLSAKFAQSKRAREALLATGDAVLTHDYGQRPNKPQSLPVDIFCCIVTEIRCELHRPMA